MNSLAGLKRGSSQAFSERLERVRSGRIQSALDEFLQRRVPIQLGGMQDPLPPMENKYRVTQRFLEILAEHDYPTLVSTKGSLSILQKYISTLATMNGVVRLSAAGVAEKYRKATDVGCDTFEITLEKIRFLRDSGLPVSLRIQPVIPGFEDEALRMAEQAANAGANHVSFEHLKIGYENFRREVRRLSGAVGSDIWQSMRLRGAKRLGRDFTLSSSAKAPFVLRAKRLCAKQKIHFGAGDTEFIHLSDGTGCCNGSSLFLTRAKQFECNFVGVSKNRRTGDLIRFEDLLAKWHPKGNVHHYLTTNSRSRDSNGGFDSWISLLAHRWNGERGPYSPGLFWGVNSTGDYDSSGFRVYKYSARSYEALGGPAR